MLADRGNGNKFGQRFECPTGVGQLHGGSRAEGSGSGQLALRDRIDGDLGSMPVAEAAARLKKEVSERQVRQVVRRPRRVMQRLPQSTRMRWQRILVSPFSVKSLIGMR